MRLQLTAVAHGGTCVGREPEGRVVLTSYGLPGEEVEARIRRVRRHHAEADVTEVVTASPDRVLPPCPWFGECGGCAWQHARYEAQVEWKAAMVEDMLRRAGVQLPADGFERVPMDDPWHYRIRGEVQAVHEAGRVSFGFYAHDSYRRVPVGACLIHDTRISDALGPLAEAASSAGLSDLDSLQLTVEPGGPGLLYSPRFTGRARDRGLPDHFLAAAAEALPGVALVDESVGLEVDGLHFRVQPDTFVQSNYRGMLRLYAKAVELSQVASGQRVLEGYGGMGIVGSLLARQGAEVEVVEENPVSVRLGRHCASLNGLSLGFRSARVEDVLARERSAPDLVLVDPPRAGLGQVVTASLARLRPARVVSISCEPSTLARDLADLSRAGYRVERGAVVDMFPHTAHVETVVSLRLDGPADGGGALHR
ncbi:MAG: class I SAM-dependent RNA methyltransferase [Candidatus Dormibacteria bacterium]